MISDKEKNTKLRQYAGYGFSVILSAAFLFLAFRNIDFSKTIELVYQASFFWIIIFILVFILSNIVRAYRWKYMIHSIKPDASAFNLYGATMIGNGINCVIPRLGEIYKAMFLGRWEKLSRSSMFGTVIVERVLDTLALWISVLASVAIYSGNLYKDVSWLKPAIIFGFLILFLGIAFIVVLIWQKEKFYKIILNIVNKIIPNASDKLSYVFEMLLDGFASIKGFKNYSLTIFLTIVMMLVYGLNSYVGFYMMKMNEVQTVSYGMAWILMTIAAFGIVIPTPGGTGSYHFIVIFVLTQLFYFDEEIASAYALLTHVLSYIIFISSTLFFIYFINNRHVSEGNKKETLLSVLKFNPDDK